MAELGTLAAVVGVVAATMGAAVRLGTHYYVDESARDRSMDRNRPLVLPPPSERQSAA